MPPSTLPYNLDLWRRRLARYAPRLPAGDALTRARDLARLTRLERVLVFGLLVVGYALGRPAWGWDDLALLTGAVLALGPLLYGGLYALNDAHDHAADRLSPLKRSRPVAAGRITPAAARRIGLALMGLGLAGALALDARVFALGLALAVVNVLYTHALKRVPGLELLGNSVTHPLRLAGGLWLAGAAGHWPLLAAWWLMVLAGCAFKRLVERRTLRPGARPVLRAYTEQGLKLVVVASLGLAALIWPALPDLDRVAAGLALSLLTLLIAGHVWLPETRRLGRLVWR
jgi:4-hydroxybenzoate polyprenyltransferase